MTKKSSLVVLIVLGLAAGMLALSGQANPTLRPVPAQASMTRQAEPLPLHVLYRHLFHHITYPQ